jgi:hypothetical protein
MNSTTPSADGGTPPVCDVDDVGLAEREALRQAVLEGTMTVWAASRQLAKTQPAWRQSALRAAHAAVPSSTTRRVAGCEHRASRYVATAVIGAAR